MLSASIVRAQRGQSVALGVVYGRRGRRLVIGRWGRCPEASIGTVVGDGLPPTPRPPPCALLLAFRERGQGGEVGSAWGLQVGYWGSSGAVLVTGWG
jgi:hypothetical protein